MLSKGQVRHHILAVPLHQKPKRPVATSESISGFDYCIIPNSKASQINRCDFPSFVLLRRDRIAADVKDFNKLGAAIDKGELDPENDAWLAFFIPFQRRQPDVAGRSYAAQLDLVGAEKTGGAGLLLAATFAKPNKPPNNLPQYKKYEALAANLDAIKKAGKSGDVVKTKKEWSTAAAAFSDYLESVEMPRDLSDRLYK